MKISLASAFHNIPVAVSLVAFTSVVTGCNAGQDQQLMSSTSSTTLTGGQPLPHIHTAGFGSGSYVASVPTDLHPNQHPFHSPQLHRHATLPQPGN